jgi:glutathione S-transferase
VVPERHSERGEVKGLTGQRGVPVLVDEDRGVTMPESDRILEFIERSYSGPEAGS